MASDIEVRYAFVCNCAFCPNLEVRMNIAFTRRESESSSQNAACAEQMDIIGRRGDKFSQNQGGLYEQTIFRVDDAEPFHGTR